MKPNRPTTLAACLGLLFCAPELWATDAAPAAEAAPSMP